MSTVPLRSGSQSVALFMALMTAWIPPAEQSTAHAASLFVSASTWSHAAQRDSVDSAVFCSVVVSATASSLVLSVACDCMTCGFYVDSPSVLPGQAVARKRAGFSEGEYNK